MKLTRIIAATTVFAAALALPLLLRQSATHAASPPPGAKAGAVPATPPPAAPPASCKTFGAGKCCSPDVSLHLAKEAIYAACGESESTFIGEAGTKDACKYHFKVAGENSDDTFVSVYTQAVKEVPDKPADPFFSYKKVGKVWVTEKSKSPKAAAMAAANTGLYMPARGYFVSVVASTKVCTKNEAITLSKSMK